MREFEDVDYIKQKALANYIISSLSIAHEKITKKCSKIAKEISELEESFAKEEDIKKLNIWSEKISEKRNNFTTILAVKNRIDTIILRNKNRIEFFDKKLKDAGIYNQKVSKTELSEMERKEMENISEQAINLNNNYGEDQNKRYFAGALLKFDGNIIDFVENMDELQYASQSLIHKIVFSYPQSVNTVTGEILLNTKLKQNLLKEIVAFATEQSKTKSIKDINAMLGGLLSFKTQIPKDVESFIAGVQNMFNVMAKGVLLEKFPNDFEEINSKLNCNAKSELIPASRKVAALAQGMASDATKNEEWESEEVRKSQEKDNQTQEAILENLKIINQATDQVQEMEEERELAQQEVKKQEEYKKQLEKEKELEEEEKINKELEEYLFAMYKDDSTEG